MILSRIVFIFGLVLLVSITQAQESSITAYKGLSKDIDLSEYGNCDSLTINGEHFLRSRSNPCKATVSFEELGRRKIEILKENKRLKSLEFKVKALPAVNAVIGQQSGGEMTLKYFLIQPGPYTKYDTSEISEKITLSSFKIQVIRGKKSIFKRLNKGGGYNSEIRNLLKRDLYDGDKVIFSDIMAEIEGFNPFPLEGIQIKIDND